MKNENEGSELLLPSPATFDKEEMIVHIAGRGIKIGGPKPPLHEGEKFLRNTLSLCPVCYRLLPAVIFERNEKVYIRKICPEHGEVEELYFGDVKLYHRFAYWERKPRGTRYVYVKLTAPCPYNCGLCQLHLQHTALANIVLTNRCDIKCWYCFFYSERVGYVYEPSLEQLRFMVRQLKKQGVTMAIQLTGGEPLLRNDLVDIVKMLKEEGVRHVQLNTNGLRIAEMMLENPEKAIGFVRELRQSGVNTVYLSFDGISPEVNFKNHWEIPFIFEAFRQGDMKSVVLVPTVMKSYNDHELGDIIRFAAYNMDIVRGVNFQPVSLTGQMRKQEREKHRITIPDAIKKIEEQTDGQIHRDAWYPVPITVPISRFIEAVTGEFKFEMANHPHCGTATYVYVERKNGKPVRFIPVTDFIDVDGLMEYLEQKAEELRSVKSKTIRYLKALKVISKLKSFIDESKAPKEVNVWKMIFNIFVKRNYKALGEWHYNFLFLGMMHFMDLYNYDVQRVMRCNIHYLTPDGRVIPFCTFNVLNDLYRDFIQKQYKIPLDEWVKKHGEFKTYKRDVKRLESHELYRKTYEEFLK